MKKVIIADRSFLPRLASIMQADPISTAVSPDGIGRHFDDEERMATPTKKEKEEEWDAKTSGGDGGDDDGDGGQGRDCGSLRRIPVFFLDDDERFENSDTSFTSSSSSPPMPSSSFLTAVKGASKDRPSRAYRVRPV